MTQLTLTSTHVDLGPALKEVKPGHPVVLKRRGRTVAALISAKDFRLYERYLEELEDRMDVAEAEKALAEDPDGIPLEDFAKELGL